MIENLTLRPVEMDDLAALQDSFWPYRGQGDLYLMLLDITGRHARNEAWGIVASIGEQVVGYGQLSRWGRRAEISDLVISESWRGNGIGTALIRHLLAIAADQAIQEVEIGAAESNPRALSLYRRLGFAEKRRVMMELGRGPEVVIYLSRQPDSPGPARPGQMRGLP